MPPSHRRPTGGQPPRRRSRVAGLRKPTGSPDPSETERLDSEQQPEPEPTAADDGSGSAAERASPAASSSAHESDPSDTAEAVEGPELSNVGGQPEESEASDVSDVVEEAESQDPLSTTAEDVDADTEQPADPERGRPRRKGRDLGRLKPATEREMAETSVGEADRSGEKRTPDNVVPHKPAPLGQTRSSSDAGAEVDAENETDSGSSTSRPYTLTALLVVLALVFAGAAVVFKMQHSEASAVTSNTAQVDVATTGEVKEAVGEGVERLFSLDYNDLEKTQEAADELLANDDVKQTYDMLMDEIRELAPEQQMMVTVRVTRSAVTLLDGDRAKVMVYIDQVATRADSNESAPGAASMWLTTERQDGEWKIAEMATYQGRDEEPDSGELTPEDPESEDAVPEEEEDEEDSAPEGMNDDDSDSGE